MSTQEELNEQLLEAAEKGYAETVKELLAAGADANAKNKIGATGLFRAAIHWVKVLLAAGSNVNAADKNGWTALMIAAEGGHTETAQALLAAGANVNAADKKGWTALTLAAYGGHTETAQALLAAGADVNAAATRGCSAGWTALMWAAKKGDTEAVKAFLDKGAEANAALKEDRRAIADALVKRPVLESLALPLSVWGGCVVLWWFLDVLRGAMATGIWWQWLLGALLVVVVALFLVVCALWFFFFAYYVVGYFVRYFVLSVSCKDSKPFWDEGRKEMKSDVGRTALTWAAQGGHTAVLKALVAAGADVNARWKADWGAFAVTLVAATTLAVSFSLSVWAGFAALWWLRDVVMGTKETGPWWQNMLGLQLMLEVYLFLVGQALILVLFFWDMVARVVWRKDDRTALMYAVEGGHTESARALVAAGADVNARSTPWNKRFWMMLFLVEAPALPLVWYAMKSGGWWPALYAVVYAWCAAKFALNRQNLAKSRPGWTALMYAAEGGHTETARALVEAGANVKARDCLGRTALKIARKNVHAATARVIEVAARQRAEKPGNLSF